MSETLSTNSPPPNAATKPGSKKDADWEDCWKALNIPWDLAASPCPPITHYMKSSLSSSIKINDLLMQLFKEMGLNCESFTREEYEQYEYFLLLELKNYIINDEELLSKDNIITEILTEIEIDNVLSLFKKNKNFQLEKAQVNQLVFYQLRLKFNTLLNTPYQQFNNQSSANILVPGCGSGLDCLMFKAYSNYDKVFGLDLTPYATDYAKNLLEKILNCLDYKHHYEENQQKDVKYEEILASFPAITTEILDFIIEKKRNINKDTIEFHAGNFFSYNFNNSFDYIFDYTFFVAIEPEKRILWAENMKKNLKDKDGVLITLVFPLLPPEVSDEGLPGPPHPVNLNSYKKVLEPLGFQLIGTEDVSFFFFFTNFFLILF